MPLFTAAAKTESITHASEVDTRQQRGALLLIAAVAVYVFFFRLGNFGVIDGSESYYPAAVREMVEAHSYLIPQMNY